MTRKQAFELVIRFGGRVEPSVSDRTTLVVVGDDDRPAAAAGEAAPPDAPPAAATPQRLTEEEFCRLVGRVPPSTLRQSYYAWRSTRSRYTAIRDDHLRYLEKWGVLRSVVRTPTDTYYGFGDVAVIKQANAELEQGATFRAVLRSLAASRDGQLALDFRTDTVAGLESKVVALPSRTLPGPIEARPARVAADQPRSAAEAKFREGERLESADTVDLEGAMKAYREAVALDPSLVAAIVNLGNLHYLLDHLAEAQALYLHAALVDPGCVEAHFNLGNVHHDRGRFEQAIVCYGEALRLDPYFADAHFYLAVTLEKTGRSNEARPHWQRYRELAPDGEWVEIAEEFSE